MASASGMWPTIFVAGDQHACVKDALGMAVKAFELDVAG
jgi:hypothetical protein